MAVGFQLPKNKEERDRQVQALVRLENFNDIHPLCLNIHSSDCCKTLVNFQSLEKLKFDLFFSVLADPLDK